MGFNSAFKVLNC